MNWPLGIKNHFKNNRVSLCWQATALARHLLKKQDFIQCLVVRIIVKSIDTAIIPVVLPRSSTGFLQRSLSIENGFFPQVFALRLIVLCEERHLWEGSQRCLVEKDQEAGLFIET